MTKSITTTPFLSADQHGDIVYQLVTEYESLLRRLNGAESVSEYEDCRVLERCGEIDSHLATSKATTVYGAIAALQRLKEELQTFVITADMPDVQSQLYVGLLDGVLSYLQSQDSIRADVRQ